MPGPRSPRGFALGARLSVLFLVVLSCGDSATEPTRPAPPDPPRATTVSVSPASGTLTAVGDTLRLSARVQDQNGQAMAGADVLWTSSADSVATVDASGLVRAAGDGTAVIEAAAEGASGTATVTVERTPSRVTVIPREAVLAPGDTLRLSAVVEDANGVPIEGAPVDWLSEKPEVAVVDSGGLVRAIGSGEGKVTATAVWHTPSGRVKGTADITVLKTAGSVVVTPPEATLAVGDTVWISAEARDAKGEPLPDSEVRWETGDASVATVDATGLAGALVRATGQGSTTITARSGPRSGTARVTVVAAVGSVVVTPPEATLAVGDTVRISAEVRDAAGAPIPDAGVKWETGDASVATVDAAGLVRALGRGSSTVTARSGPVTGTARVTVVTTAGSVVVTPAEPVLTVGDTLPLEAEIRDTEGAPMSGTGVQWETSDARVAVVDAAGLVRAVGQGRATVTARSGPLSGRAEVTVVERSDRGALASLYHATGGANWVESTNWLTDAPLGEWHGVTTDQAGRVMSLELDSNNLVGSIPPQLAQLTRLGRLSVMNNGLGGPIPPELARLSGLHYLDLSRNDLTGPVPPELSRLTDVTALNLGMNRLSGPIPPELGDLARVTWLNLGNNDLTGTIPPELAIPGLYTLLLNGNLLEGSVPESFLRSDITGFDFAFPEHRNLYLCLPGTAAFVAWSARVSGEPGVRFCSDSDRAGLRALYEATGGAGWANSSGWLSGPAVGGWHGVETDPLGRVTALDLANNGLSGELPVQLGHLEAIRSIEIGGNALTGRLPASLAALPLRELRYAGTGLCAPADASFRAWLNTVSVHEGTGVECASVTDRDILAILYHATGGPNWRNRRNWLTDAPLGEWHGVEVDAEGRVVELDLNYNNLAGAIPPELGRLTHLERLQLGENPLKGPIPPELGQLSRLRQLQLFFTQLSGEIPPELGQLEALEELWLERIPLTGPIPRELGNLTRLEFLAIPYSNLSGPIPPELGRLTRLEKIYLGDNQLSGEIPPELGRLTRLNTLNLLGNRLTGPIPPELGALSALEFAWFHENALTGPIPREFGNLSSARILFLANNDLSGGVPAAFGRLERLEFLNLSNNPKMIGVLPPSLAALDQLDTFHAGGTALCAPDEAEFRAWLATVQTRRVQSCPSERRSRAYLTQAVQSLDYPVPLVAGQPALLRVFVTALRETGARVPPVRARFYHGGAEVHRAEIPGGAEPIPVEIQEGRLATSANARIPASVVRPGLEMVIEIDPDGTLDPGLGVERRIPATGRAAIEVERMPALPLTWIPMVSQERPDSSIVDLTRSLTAESPFFWATRNLLPIDELDLTVHDVVLTSTRNADALLREVEAIRVMEGGTGYYMGAMANLTGAAGVALTPGRSSVVGPGDLLAAHELGHNLNLSHAPCGGAGSPDPSFPSPNASIGAWGYDFRDGGLIPPGYKDLMSYCESQWISDFHFTKALLYRLNREAAAAPVRPPAVESLLLWGGLDGTGTPVLEPSFVVDAPPVLPRESGAYELTGESGDGEVLFSLGFEMPEVADGGAPSFAFALPRAGRVGGTPRTDPARRSRRVREPRYRKRAAHDDQRDAASGRVLSLLRGGGTPDAAPAPGQELEVRFSRGVPEEAAWQR